MSLTPEPDAPLRIVFAGTPDFAAHSLQALIESHHIILAVYCQPDRPAGRGKKIVYGPVKQLALKNQIDVRQPRSLTDQDAMSALRNLAPDLMVVAAYGLLLPQEVLDIPRHGCINVHASLLPRWRGAAPIQRAIIAGDEQSGITIMQMERGLDTGPMLLKKTCNITATDTGSSLHDRLAALGAAALLETLPQLGALQNEAQRQDADQASYAAKLDKREAAINWQLAAPRLSAQIRAFNAWPVCYSHLGDSRVRVWSATAHPHQGDVEPGTIVKIAPEAISVACGSGLLQLETLQLPGAKPLAVKDLLNGRPDLFKPGQRFY